MRKLTDGYFYKDLHVGMSVETFGRTVQQSDISSYVQLTGLFEETFINAEYAKKNSLFGKVFAPGALVFSLAEGLAALAGLFHQGLAFLGLNDFRILQPVAVGDTITVTVSVVSKRPTSKPGRGIVEMAHAVRNQDGTLIMEYMSTRMLTFRPAGPEDEAAEEGAR
jgi:3-hydroxybutyryl-CoA dehydratase